MLIIENLNVYAEDKKILDNINLVVKDNEVIAIIGPNGSGKSSLARAIINDQKLKKEGKIIYNNTDITNLETEEIARLGIFYSFQEPPEIENLRLRTLLKFLLKDYDENKILELGREFNLPEDFLDRGVFYNYSGGEKRKLNLLIAILLNKDLYIFDEIDSGIDIEFQKKIKNIINELKKSGKTIMIITHNIKFLKDIDVDKIVVMKDGKIISISGKEIIDIVEKYGYSGF